MGMAVARTKATLADETLTIKIDDSSSRRRADRGGRPDAEWGCRATRHFPGITGVARAIAYRLRLPVCAPGLARGHDRSYHDVGSAVVDCRDWGWWRHPQSPQPPQADDVPWMQEAYTGDVALKADRVRYINTDLKMMNVAYTGLWVAETTKPSSAKPSTSKWTWSTTSSEMSTSFSLQAGIVSTIASQVQGNLAGRTVSRDDVSFGVLQELSDVFRMAMLPEFQDSIVDEVLEPANPWEAAWPCRKQAAYCILQHYIRLSINSFIS